MRHKNICYREISYKQHGLNDILIMRNKISHIHDTTNKEKGFTLIELLVVIVIIGVLAAIALPIFLNQQKAAIDATLKSDLKTIANAQYTYITKNPSSYGTININELRKLVPTLSDKSVIGTWVTEGKGFCVAGKNNDGTANGEIDSPAGKYMWYDSALGGFMKDATTGAAPLGGACQGYPDRPPRIWYYGTPSAEQPDRLPGWY